MAKHLDVVPDEPRQHMTSISQRAAPKSMPEREIAQHKGSNRIVTDDDVGNALRWLAENAAEIGEAKARIVKAGHMIKHVEALLFLASEEKTIDAKKASVRVSKKWLDAVDEEAEAAGEFEKMKALREAANARVEAWRSETATLRTNAR